VQDLSQLLHARVGVVQEQERNMYSTRTASLALLPLLAGVALGDAYANNQNPIVVDSPQVAANFPDIEGVEILAPAFLNPETVPSTWSNGTSGPTPQSTLGKI
jgi:hypothetical protein